MRLEVDLAIVPSIFNFGSLSLANAWSGKAMAWHSSGVGSCHSENWLSFYYQRPITISFYSADQLYKVFLDRLTEG